MLKNKFIFSCNKKFKMVESLLFKGARAGVGAGAGEKNKGTKNKIFYICYRKIRVAVSKVPRPVKIKRLINPVSV